MKYVGATDSFIKGPFVIEGAYIGMISAFIAFIIISFAYGGIYESTMDFMKNLSFELMQFSQIRIPLLLSFLGIGIVTGIISSLFSLRKYLKV